MEPILLAFLLLIFTLLRLLKKRRVAISTSHPPPGPWKLPLIGNIHQMVGSLPHHRLKDLAKKYGPIMQLQVGEVPTVIISSSQAAKAVLKTHEHNFAERPHLLVADIMFYNRTDIGFAPYGDYWRQMRKICILELISAKRVSSFRSIREEEVSNFINIIYSKAGSPINLSKMIFDLLIGITARTSIGKKCKNQEAFRPIIAQAVDAIGGVNIADVFPSSKLLHKICKVRSRLENLHREADMILDDIINEHRARKYVTAGTDDQEKEVEDLLDVLLNLQIDGNLEFSLATDNIKAIIFDMFSAGSETASTLLEWAMSELLKNPRVMKKAQEEVREVFSDTRNVHESGLHDLKFLKLIIKETSRLHPPIAVLPRECTRTCEIGGYEIKAKSKVLVNVWALGRDAEYWVEAEKFCPERFLDSSVDYKGNDFQLIPFGAGKRMCPGILFGTVNVEISLAYLLYHFDWKLSDGAPLQDLDMEEAFGCSVKRKNQLNLIPIAYATCP